MSDFDIPVLSLGYSCQTAFQIRKYFKRERAYFFDWLITEKMASVDLVVNQFDKDNFLSHDVSIVDNGTRVLDHYSELKFQHDFPSVDGFIKEDYSSYIEAVKSKYLALRLRVLEALQSDAIYIRYEWPTSQIYDDALMVCRDFKSIINGKGRKSLYVLVSEGVRKTVFLDDIVVFKLNPYNGTEVDRWKGNEESWNDLFDGIKEYLK